MPSTGVGERFVVDVLSLVCFPKYVWCVGKVVIQPNIKVECTRTKMRVSQARFEGSKNFFNLLWYVFAVGLRTIDDILQNSC